VKEQEHHKKAFEFYYGLGERRNYKMVAEEFGVSIGAVKMWGRSFDWSRRLRERDAEVGSAVAERSMKDGIERGVRNLKIIEMGLLQVAKAIAEGKVKPTVSDLDRLIRLEEFLKEERGAGEQTRVIFEWRDASNPSEEQEKEAGGPSTEGE
jgi:hypothetical protein